MEKSIPKRVRKIEKTLKKAEVKHKDYIAPDVNIYTTPTVVNLTAIAQGDAKDQRIGDSCTLKSIQMRAFLQQDTDTAAVTNLYRIVIVRETSADTTEAAPAWTDVFENSTGISSLREINGVRSGRYQVIYDRVFSLSKDADGTTMEKRFFKFYKKINYKVTWEASGTIPQRNGLYLMFMGTSADTVTDLNYDIRVRHTDL